MPYALSVLPAEVPAGTSPADIIRPATLAEEVLARLMPQLMGQETCLHCTLTGGEETLRRARITTHLRGAFARNAPHSGTLAILPAQLPALLEDAKELLMAPATRKTLAARTGVTGQWWFRDVVSLHPATRPHPGEDVEWLLRRAAQRIEWALHYDAIGAVRGPDGTETDLPEPPPRPLAEARGIVRTFLVTEGGPVLRHLVNWAAQVPAGAAAVMPPLANPALRKGLRLWVGSPVGRALLPEFTDRADWAYISTGTAALGLPGA